LEFEHTAGAHVALGAVHGDVHIALRAHDDDVAGIDGVRCRRREQ
jgi:hypothetical protein